MTGQDHHAPGFRGMRRVDESEASILFECPFQPDEHAVVVNRCQATRRSGAQCRGVAADGEDLCWRHARAGSPT